MIDIKKINWKNLIVSILISLGTGVVAGLITRNSVANYAVLKKPSFAPPAWLFPIAWSVLYILMGISAYLIYESVCSNRTRALRIYGVQLIVNFFWPIIFFNLQMYMFAFVWIILLWVLIIAMIVSFYRCNKASAYLQIPYLIWVTFATALTYAIFMIN